MNADAKISHVRNLDEKSLRENVLIPLFARMGFKTAIAYHGPMERGKDIICLDYDRLGNREYLAVVVKTTDLHGSLSSRGSLREVLYQIEQCFDVPYVDLFGMRRITMDRVWVVTSGRIVSGAADSVFDHLTKRSLSKLLRFIEGQALVQLIDQHYPAYWDASVEPVDVLTEQRHRLAAFAKRLLVSLGGDPSDVEATVNQVIHSAFPPTVALPPDRSLARVSPYRVELDSISEEYSHDFFSESCGPVRDAFFTAKKNIYYAMFDVDEIVDHYEEVMKKTDPRELVQAFEDALSNDYPFWRSSFGRASDACRDIEYLRDGLADINALREKLEEIDRLEWAAALVDSVRDLEGEIGLFLSHLEKDDFSLHWRIETREGRGRLRLTYEEGEASVENAFSTEHEKTVQVHGSGQQRTRAITVKDITEKVQCKIREHLDKMLADHGCAGEVAS